MTAMKNVIENAKRGGGPDACRRGMVAWNCGDADEGVSARLAAAQFGHR
ncbi:hypothetical protein [Undibacterium sp.]|nr:hypothetical protein [Undibacterium sp.]HTD02960.1 hypothetical protein [Undibacterium sp.]